MPCDSPVNRKLSSKHIGLTVLCVSQRGAKGSGPGNTKAPPPPPHHDLTPSAVAQNKKAVEGLEFKPQPCGCLTWKHEKFTPFRAKNKKIAGLGAP